LNGADGAAEVYGIVRSTISGNAVFGNKIFSNLIFKDIGFEIGGDANTENNQLSPEVRKFDIGGALTFDLPGTVVLGVLAQKEWNYNSFLEANISQFSGCTGAGPCYPGDRSFNWTPRLELLISEPLSFLPIPLTWNSFTGVTFPKGSGISSAQQAALVNGLTPWSVDTNETKTEVFEDNRLTLDAGKLTFGRAGVWETYVGGATGTINSAPIITTVPSRLPVARSSARWVAHLAPRSKIRPISAPLITSSERFFRGSRMHMGG
jgi:hypothetical protein